MPKIWTAGRLNRLARDCVVVAATVLVGAILMRSMNWIPSDRESVMIQFGMVLLVCAQFLRWCVPPKAANAAGVDESGAQSERVPGFPAEAESA